MIGPDVSASLPCVLVVDDNPGVRSFVRAALTSTANSFEAQDGEEALQLLDQWEGVHAVSVILLDHVLPKLTGLDILRLVRQRWPWIAVIMMTASSSEELVIQALRGGARDYIKKPVSLDELLAAVRTNLPRVAPHDRSVGRSILIRENLHAGISRALAFTRQHFTETITLTELAREASVSKFHFCHLFHKQLGLPFKKYLLSLRVGRAQALLANPTLSITEVCYESGFSDLSHFDKVFRRLASVSPSEYRKTVGRSQAIPTNIPAISAKH